MTTQAISSPTFAYSYTIGNQGTPPAHGFSAPVDVAIGRDGLLYVVCSYYEYPPTVKFIVKCNLDEEYLGHFGSYGSGDGQFTWPNSIAVDRDGNSYLSDEWLNQVTVYDADGAFLRKFGVEGTEGRKGDIRSSQIAWLTGVKEHQVEWIYSRVGNKDWTLNKSSIII